MRYRHLLLSIVLVVATLLSACSFGQTPPGPTPGAGQPTAAPGASPQPGGVVTIGFGVQEWERRTYEPLVEKFQQENPNIRVQLVSLDEIMRTEPGQSFNPSEQSRKIVSAVDTALVWFVSQEDIKNNYYYNLTPLMDGDATFQRDDFYPGALSAAMVDNNIYALPREMNVQLLSYNKDLWAARNLPKPDPNWKWKDLVAAAEQLTSKRGDTVDVYGLMEGGGTFALVGELSAAGVNIWAMPPDQARLDTPEIQTALERIVELLKSGVIYSPPRSKDGASNNFDSDAMKKLVNEQRVGIWYGGMFGGGGPNEEKPPFAVGSLPFPDLGLPFFSGGQSFVISSGSQHPQESWRWIEFLSRQPRNEEDGPRVMGASQIPARKSVAESSGYWTKLDEETAAAVRAVVERSAAPLPPGIMNQRLNIFGPLSEALNAALHDNKPANEALREAQNKLQEQIAQIALTPEPTPDTSPIVVSTPVAEVAAAGATKITFMATGVDTAVARRIAREFNQQNPQIFVEVKEPDYRSGQAMTMAKIASESDCFGWWGAPSEDETVTTTLDLQPLIETDASFNLNDYPPALLSPYRKGNSLYGLPYALNLRALTYNQTAFDAAGLEYPRASWTLDNLLSAAQQLTKGTGNEKQFGFASTGAQTQDLIFFMDRFGARAVTGSDNEARPNFTDEKVVQAIRFYVDLLKNTSPHEKLTGYTREGWDNNTWQLMNDGRIGMWFEEGGWGFIGGPGNNEKFTRAIAPPPLGSGTLSTNDVNSRGLYISATSQHADACWTWLKHLSTDTTGLQGAFPARISVAESDAFKTAAQPGSLEVYNAYREALNRDPNAASATERFYQGRIDHFWFFRAVDRALQGKDLEQELAEAQKLTENFLACLPPAGNDENLTDPTAIAQANDIIANCAKQVDPTYNGFRQPSSSSN